MMANWNKLNEQFDSLLDSMSQEDWQSWAKNRGDKKLMRTSEMLLKAKLQEEKLILANSNSKSIFSQKISSEQSFNIVSIIGNISHIGSQPALAA